MPWGGAEFAITPNRADVMSHENTTAKYKKCLLLRVDISIRLNVIIKKGCYTGMIKFS